MDLIDVLSATSIAERLWYQLRSHCIYATRDEPIPNALQKMIEALPMEDREEVATRYYKGFSPLFLACTRDLFQTVTYLFDKCGAKVEQKSRYEYLDLVANYEVTPLWCAVYSGSIRLVKYLLDKGANINPNYTGGDLTPLSVACCMGNLDMVKFLIQNGADINIRGIRNTNSLMISVQSPKICEYLLKHNINIHAKDTKLRTALHYAIHKKCINTIKLLLKYGADHRMQSLNGDALQAACLKGNKTIYYYLLRLFNYPKDKVADCYELLASTYIFKNELLKAKLILDISLDIRNMRDEKGVIPKLPLREPQKCFGYQCEFKNLVEMLTIFEDDDSLKIQGLLVAERILGPSHKKTLKRMFAVGLTYSKTDHFQKTIDLWTRVVELRIKKNTILTEDTMADLCTLVQYINKKFLPAPRNLIERKQRFEETLDILHITLVGLNDVRYVFRTTPRCSNQLHCYDLAQNCLIQLNYMLIQLAADEEDMEVCKMWFIRTVNANMACPIHGDNGLHICTMTHNAYFESARDYIGEYDINICECVDWAVTLLDQAEDKVIFVPNFNSNRYRRKTISLPLFQITNCINRLSLQCMAATAVRKGGIQYKCVLPKTLEKFTDCH